MKIYVDSSIREGCYVIEGWKPVIIPYAKPVTGNVGEYKAVILALCWACSLNHKQVEILSDSLLVVEQVRGNWKCRKAHLLPYRDQVKNLLGKVDGTIFWIPREENLAGLVLENLAGLWLEGT